MELGGERIIYGLNDLVCGQLEEIGVEKALENAKAKGIIKR